MTGEGDELLAEPNEALHVGPGTQRDLHPSQLPEQPMAWAAP